MELNEKHPVVTIGAVRRPDPVCARVHGDIERVHGLLRELPDIDLAGGVGGTLLREAAVAGQAEIVEELLLYGVDPNRPWSSGVEPVSWLAEQGAWNILNRVLFHCSRHGPAVPERSLRAALALARTWLGVDPEQKLRRRLDAVNDPATVVDRDRVPAWRDGGPMVTRIRIRTGDGRQDQVWAAHHAVVTLLEDELGVVTPCDELAERALHAADVDSCDAAQAFTTIAERAERDAEVFDWLAARLAHPTSEHRLFAAQIVHRLSFDRRPFAAHAVDVLADRIRDEPDPAVLDSLIGAFAEFAYCARPGGYLSEILPHAHHRDPLVRARVAMELSRPIGSRRNPTVPAPTCPSWPALITTLFELAADPDPDTRTAALVSLADAHHDTAHLRAIFTAHLSDPHPPARITAAVGLALRDDSRGREALHRLETDPATAVAARESLDDIDRIPGRQRPLTQH
ncbi:hypothetical protein [Actinoplanes sp. NPDC026623]|uniref:hypothetical protein n=1 Tax=Actinoplanes sp. NPDC026623 TaxID=3155610 RepID=UPI0033EF3836